ncbi:hypothetical protein [Pseudochelatococcus contaminans]|uniref:Uncharacterized protein n=1 Tax=Pseudochelatococcus contaminans TaxID=1538103 RepID=A0A7W6EET5_9HYPH|nr:hypothetical protein [Pseudochelatococcus contaminans]MBB3808399.1 hypothetical protein [Pseudochelatococcus contaminans]
MNADVVWALELSAGVFSTLIAAFMGAKVAFALERRRDAEKQRDQDADGLQAAIFVLCRQLTLVSHLQTNSLDGLRDDEDRHLLLPPMSAKLIMSTRIDFNWVSHMLRGHEDCAGLAFLFIASDDSIDMLYQVAEARRSFFMSHIQPRLEKAGITELKNDRRHLDRSLYDEADAVLLQQYTDKLYDACDAAVRHLEQGLAEAKRISPAAFPGYDFKFVLPHWVQQK